MKEIILSALLGTALTSTSVFAMKDEEITFKSSGSKRLAPTALADERDLKNRKIDDDFIPTNGIVTEEHELNETQPIPATYENYIKYMVLPEQDRESVEARAALLKKWETITFRDVTKEDWFGGDWNSLNAEEEEKFNKNFARHLKSNQTRFIPGNGKDVKISGDLVMAILDRSDHSFYKDGYYFRLTPIKIPLLQHPLLHGPLRIHSKKNGWECDIVVIAYEINLIEDVK